MNPIPKFTTACKLCRKNVAESPALNIPVIGDPGKQVQELLKVLLKHLTLHHTRELAEGAALFNEFQAFRILSAFEFEDPSMSPRLERIRAVIFSMVRKNGFSDGALEHMVAGFGLDPDDAKEVNEAMRIIRDCCCEIGRFAPAIPEESKLIKV